MIWNCAVLILVQATYSTVLLSDSECQYLAGFLSKYGPHPWQTVVLPPTGSSLPPHVISDCDASRGRQISTDFCCGVLKDIQNFEEGQLLIRTANRKTDTFNFINTLRLVQNALNSANNIFILIFFFSFTPSVRLSVRVRSVERTVLVGSMSHLQILSSNFRRCVACKVPCKILKFWFLPIFLIWNFYFVFFLTWDLMWITSTCNQGAAGGISERRRSNCSSYICSMFLIS